MQNHRICIHANRPSALLRVTGEDAFAFLQGQFTNELRQMADSMAYGLWLNQKGRVLADSYVLRLSEKEFVLVSPGSASAVIRQRLESYVVADDVTVTDETEKASGLVLWGEGCAERLRVVMGTVPGHGKFLSQDQLFVFAGRRSSHGNFEVIGPTDRISDLSDRFKKSGWVETGSDELEAARLESGIPAIPADIGPGDLPIV